MPSKADNFKIQNLVYWFWSHTALVYVVIFMHIFVHLVFTSSVLLFPISSPTLAHFYQTAFTMIFSEPFLSCLFSCAQFPLVFFVLLTPTYFQPTMFGLLCQTIPSPPTLKMSDFFYFFNSTKIVIYCQTTVMRDLGGILNSQLSFF